MRSQNATAVVMAGWSDDAAISFPVEEDRTRQEFAEESDVNVILRRFGAGGFEMRPVVYGVQDLDLDLQGVYDAERVSLEAWERLPERLRKRYAGWSALIAAMEAGEASLVDPDGVVVDLPVKDDPPVVSG